VPHGATPVEKERANSSVVSGPLAPPRPALIAEPIAGRYRCRHAHHRPRRVTMGRSDIGGGHGPKWQSCRWAISSTARSSFHVGGDPGTMAILNYLRARHKPAFGFGGIHRRAYQGQHRTARMPDDGRGASMHIVARPAETACQGKTKSGQAQSRRSAWPKPLQQICEAVDDRARRRLPPDLGRPIR